MVELESTAALTVFDGASLLIVVGVCFNLVGAAEGWGLARLRKEGRFDGVCLTDNVFDVV